MRLLICIFCIILLTLGCQNEIFVRAKGLVPPVAKQVPKFFDEYGKRRADPYFWLSNPTDTAVVSYLKAENAYVEASLAHTKSLQKRLFKEMTSRLEDRAATVPVRKNGYWYYSRYEKGNEYATEYRKKGDLSAVEEVLLDRPSLSKGHKVYRLLEWELSRDNNLVAYLVDTAGDRRNTLFLKNLSQNILLPETMTDVANGGLAFSDDGKYLFYLKNDPTVRGSKLYRHEMGTPAANDVLLYDERDVTFSLNLERSASGRFLLLHSQSTLTSECRFLEAQNPLADWQLIQARQRDRLYTVNHFGEESNFFIYTNADKARNFKIVTTPTATPQYPNWKTVVKHNDTILIEKFHVYKNYVITQEKINGLSNIAFISRLSLEFQNIPFDEPTFNAEFEIGDHDTYDLENIRYTYTSLTTPPTVFLYHRLINQSQVIKPPQVPNYTIGNYKTDRIWAKAEDGVSVPISLVYRKDKFKKDGSNPCLLYAYGSYGISTDANFRPEIVSLLDRGFVFAIAHIRGGQEMGRQWYENGKLLKKKHTFTDFNACAVHLIQERYTNSTKLFANGRSAGGMLMGAITNLRPDLYRGVIAEVPWMDVITDMFNDQLPLTTLEYDEWGNPKDRNYYDYMLSWSPYDQLKPSKFPAILATGGLHDTQVPYYSPAKWVAKMRPMQQNGANPIYLKTDLESGHGGLSGRMNRYEATAFKYAFILDLLDIQN